MGPGEVALIFGYPLILVGGALSRINIPSLIYLLGFAITTIWAPHPVLPKRRIIASVVCWFLTIFSGLINLGHIIFQAVFASQANYGRGWLPDNSPWTTVLQYSGFTRIPDIGEGFRLITPDVVVFVVSVVFVILLKRRIIFTRAAEERARTHMAMYIPRSASTLNGLAILAILFLNGITYASVLQAVYFVLFIFSLIGKAFLRLPVTRIIDILYYPTLIYNGLHIFCLYVVQAGPIHVQFPQNVADTLGLKFYSTDITPNPLMGATICISWVASIFLLVLLAAKKRNADLRDLRKLNRDYLDPSSQASQKLLKAEELSFESKFWRVFTRLVREWGWRLCILALLAVSLFLPYLFGVILLIAVCVASVVPQAILERYFVVAGITIYLIFTTSAQYFYNIPGIGSSSECEAHDMRIPCALGLRFYPYTWAEIGLQTLACTLLAMNWGFFALVDPHERNTAGALDETAAGQANASHRLLFDKSVRIDEPEDETEPLSLDDSKSRRRSIHHRSRSRHSTIQRESLMSFGEFDSKSPDEPTVAKKAWYQRFASAVAAWWHETRPAWKAVGFWALQQSYLLSLGGVYIAGLHRVNLLNSVYLLILILFLTSSRLARKFWLGLVLYCELAILAVYTWNAVPWTKDIKTDVVSQLVGLQSYPSADKLFTEGLVWHMVIMLFAVIQLWVMRYTAAWTKDGGNRPKERIPHWMAAIGRMFFWLWDEYGLVPVYTVFVVVSSIDGVITLINILYILLVFVCLGIHMLTRRADVHIKRFWIFVVVASGIILIARYAYQFQFVQKFIQVVLPVAFLEAVGFTSFSSGAVFMPLLGNTCVLLVAVIQLQTFFAKKDPSTGLGHNAHARRMEASDLDQARNTTDDDLFTDLDYSSHGSRAPSMPSSIQYPEDDSNGLTQPIGGRLSVDEAQLVSERGLSGKAARSEGGEHHLLFDEEVMDEDIARHPTSTLEQRKKRLRRKHAWEVFLYAAALDFIYWIKRFCMLHAYKVTALVMVAIAIRSPSGLNSIYVEVAILSLGADHLTDGVGVILLLYTQLVMLFTLVYQFNYVSDGLSAYQPLLEWGGFEHKDQGYGRFSLIFSRLAIIILLLIQRFSHRWKNDWYRIKRLEIRKELEAPNDLNAQVFYAEMLERHQPMSPTLARADPTAAMEEEHTHPAGPVVSASVSSEMDPLERANVEEAKANSRYGILKRLQELMAEDTRDDKEIEELKKRYMYHSELTLFLYEPSDQLVRKDSFTISEFWNAVAWLLSNLLAIAGYPFLVGALLVAIFVHKSTVYGIIFLVILGITMLTRSVRWSASSAIIKGLAMYISIEMLLQYILNLDLPPPNLSYPWSSWHIEWLSWLGLKQPLHSGDLIADFVLLMVVSRIRRITPEDLKHIHWDHYWHYLVGPVTKIKENKTWTDSIRYSVYRFSPFVILLLIFIAGTIHPDILSLIYVFFALLFIFRESTIYAERNKIWRWARLYNYLLMMAVILYQIPAIPVPTEAEKDMSPASIIGLRKFSQGGSILFSMLIFVMLGIQKRMFSRTEFDELVLSILDEEEKGVKLAQERFQEWKMERQREFQRVKEEKRRRRQQLDFLKAARARQHKLWQKLAGGGPGGADGHSRQPSASYHAPSTVPVAPADIPGASPANLPNFQDYVNDPRMRTMSTTRDLIMLQKDGGLEIEEDPTSHFMTMRFKPRASGPSILPQTQPQSLPQTTDSEDLAQIRLQPRSPSPSSSSPFTRGDEESDQEHLPTLVSDDEEEEDVLAAALTQRPEETQDEIDEKVPRCCCFKIPQWVIDAADLVVSWLDKQTEGYLSTKPHYSRKKKIWAGIYKIYQMNSAILCYMLFLVNSAVNADLISLFYPLSMFLYAVLETPRPHKFYWNLVFVYASCTILLKFFFQISLFCMCHSPSGLGLTLSSTCAADPLCKPKSGRDSNSFVFSKPRLFGISTYSTEQYGTGGTFIGNIATDLLVLIAVFLHRYWLKKLGYWNFVARLTLSKEGSEEPMSQRQLADEARRFQQILLKLQKKREHWTRYAAEKRKKRFNKKLKLLGVDAAAVSIANLEDMDDQPQDLESGPPTNLATHGLKIVSNPLFKLGESDFETDSEEMLPRTPAQRAKLSGVPEAEPAPSLKVKVAKSTSATTASASMDEEPEKQHEELKLPLEEESEESGEESDSESSSGSSTMDGYDDEEENLYAQDSTFGRSQKRAVANAKRWFKSRASDFAHFWQNVVAHKPGRELYVEMWFIELLCFFFILLIPSPFIGNSEGNVAEFLTQSRLPNAYVLTLLVQFVLIVIERVLYLYRAIRLKLIYHIFLVLFYHVWLLFLSPLFTGVDFRSQPLLITFYMMKLLYLYLSSMQIMHGYPAFVQGQFLTDSSDPGILRWLIYVGYRAIPFVYELRTLLDWTVTGTSLTFFEWLKCEDIYANLFLVKCRVSQDKTWSRNVGDPQAWYTKLGMGVLLFIGLAFVIWFPLLVLMQGSPGNTQNPIQVSSVSIGFTGYATPIYTAVAAQSNLESLPGNIFNILRADQSAITYDDGPIAQWIKFENYSDSGWSISPPARAQLMKDVLLEQASLTVRLTFTRQYGINTGPTAEKDLIYPLATKTYNWCPQVYDVLNGTRTNFSVPNIINRFWRIPSSTDPTQLNAGATPEIGLVMALRNPGTVGQWNPNSYWNAYAIPDVSIDPKYPWFNSSTVELVTFSAEAPKGLLRSLASIGLIGLYVGVVLAVARFLRLAITDLAFRIIYEDMPACDELISYCEDIYTARQDGDLVLEEELYRELIEIYRSPETLIARTVRTHPRFAGRSLSEKEKRRLQKEQEAFADPQVQKKLD